MLVISSLIYPSKLQSFPQNRFVFHAANMLDLRSVQNFAASPGVQATAALLIVSFVIQWYLSLPPKPKFPIGDLDEKDPHGSFMRARSKVS
jgi:hypothetical protein